MKNGFDTNKIIRGSFGAVWLGSDELANVKQFEAKITLEYEDVKIMGDLGTHKRYVGFNGEGTMTLHKTDSRVAKLLAEGIASGKMPDLKIIGKLADPTADGEERVELTGVTINELMALKFENKELLEEEVPFNFSGFRFIDTI